MEGEGQGQGQGHGQGQGQGEDHSWVLCSDMAAVGKGCIKSSVSLGREQLKITLKIPHPRSMLMSKEGPVL